MYDDDDGAAVLRWSATSFWFKFSLTLRANLNDLLLLRIWYLVEPVQKVSRRFPKSRVLKSLNESKFQFYLQYFGSFMNTDYNLKWAALHNESSFVLLQFSPTSIWRGANNSFLYKTFIFSKRSVCYPLTYPTNTASHVVQPQLLCKLEFCVWSNNLWGKEKIIINNIPVEYSAKLRTIECPAVWRHVK